MRGAAYQSGPCLVPDTKARRLSLRLRMKSVVSCFGLLLAAALLARPAVAQIAPPNSQTGLPADTARPRAITPRAERRAQAAADSAKRTERLFGLRLTRPGKATLLAAVLPGAGQIYNHSYWKLPLVYGALGATIGLEVHYQQGFSEFSRAADLVSTGQLELNDPDLGPRASKFRSLEGLQQGVQFYRGYRDIFYLYIGIAYSLQVVDALVDAHLKDFDVSDDLSLHWQPALLPVPGRPLALPTAPGVAFSLRVR